MKTVSGIECVHYWGYIWIKYRPPSPGRYYVTLLSLSDAALCGLLRKQSGLYIQRAVEKVRQREEDSKMFYTGPSKSKYSLHHCHFRFRLSCLLLCCLCSHLLSSHVLESVFALPLNCLLLSDFVSHTFSVVSHSSTIKRQRDARRLSWAFFHTYFWRKTTLPSPHYGGVKKAIDHQMWSWFTDYFHIQKHSYCNIIESFKTDMLPWPHWWSSYVLQALNATWICASAIRKLRYWLVDNISPSSINQNISAYFWNFYHNKPTPCH